MSREQISLVDLLGKVIHCQKRLLSQLAADLDISYATLGWWLPNEGMPNTRSRRRLAEYSGAGYHIKLA